jgi:cell division septation protein DedD
MILLLDRAKIAAIIGGFTAMGLLLFLAGLLLGLGLRLPDALRSAHAPHVQVAGDAPASAGSSSILPAAGEYAAPSPASPHPDGEFETATSPSRPTPTLTDVGLTTALPPAPTQPAAPSERAEMVASSDTPATPHREPQARPPVGATFAVQVGAFLLEREAQTLIEELSRKGYTPFIVQAWGMRNGKRRLWHTVRIGEYPDRDQARYAAADFTKQEGQPAIIRPAGSP